MSDYIIGIARLVIGAPSLIEVCIHLGDFLVMRLRVYRQTDEKIALYVLRI
jgi:hypothetical protein